MLLSSALTFNVFNFESLSGTVAVNCPRYTCWIHDIFTFLARRTLATVIRRYKILLLFSVCSSFTFILSEISFHIREIRFTSCLFSFIYEKCLTHFFPFSNSAQENFQLKKEFYSMEHFLSITLFREVHDSTEREQRRDVKKVKECEQIAMKTRSFPDGSALENSRGKRTWSCVEVFLNEGWICYEGKLECNSSISIFITFFPSFEWITTSVIFVL